MTARRPAEVGMPVSEVDTPALLLDLEAMERNLSRMARFAQEAGVRLRPHAKSHKCPAIARRQVALGAVGVCCQKVGEAEAMVEGGIGDVLVSNEVIGRRKLDRLAALAREASVAVCVDDLENIEEIESAARRFGSQITVLVELDVGAGRCGLVPGVAAVGLARRIAASDHLRFGGLQAYQGAAQHLRSPAERAAAIEAAVRMTRETMERLGEAGFSCASVTGAGTGTFRLEAASGLFNELQPGSYVFMDGDYARNLDEGGRPLREFEHSLFVLSQVMSRPSPTRAVLDAGLKAQSVDSGLPDVWRVAGARVTKVSDEHSVVCLEESTIANFGLGMQVRLVPGHCDPTVNLYDWLVGFRGETVECLWPITARGALL